VVTSILRTGKEDSFVLDEEECKEICARLHNVEGCKVEERKLRKHLKRDSSIKTLTADIWKAMEGEKGNFFTIDASKRKLPKAKSKRK